MLEVVIDILAGTFVVCTLNKNTGIGFFPSSPAAVQDVRLLNVSRFLFLLPWSYDSSRKQFLWLNTSCEMLTDFFFLKSQRGEIVFCNPSVDTAAQFILAIHSIYFSDCRA